MVATIWPLFSICLANPKSPNLRRCPFFMILAGLRSLHNLRVTCEWYLIWRVRETHYRFVWAFRQLIFLRDGILFWYLWWDLHHTIIGWYSNFWMITWHHGTWRYFRNVIFVGFRSNFWVLLLDNHHDQLCLNEMVTILFG